MNKCQYYAGYTWELTVLCILQEEFSTANMQVIYHEKAIVHLFPRSASDFVTTDHDRHPSYPQCISKIAAKWPMACLHSAAGPWLTGRLTRFPEFNDVHSNITYFHTIPAYLMLRSTTLNYIEVSQTTACQTHLVKLERIVLPTRFDFFFVRTKCKGGWSEIPTDPIHAEVWSIFFLVIKTK